MATLVECFTRWDPRLPLWDPSAQAVCALTFGRVDDSANIALASQVLLTCQQWNKRYCIQGEIADCMQMQSMKSTFDLLEGFISSPSQDRHGRGYVGSFEAVQEQYERFLKPNGIKRVHLCAKYPHAWRVIQCYRHFGVRVVSCNTTDIPWPVNSTQRWCCGPPRYYPYEVLARLHYWKKGHI